MSREVSTAQVIENARGRFAWVAWPHPELGAHVPVGIERVRLSKLVRLLGPRKARDVRYTLDIDAGRLVATWTRHDGGRGRLAFRMQRIPKLGSGRRRGALQSFEWWADQKNDI